MHWNQSTPTVAHSDGQLLSSCGNTIWSWLIIHLCYTWSVTAQILFPSVMMVIFGWRSLRTLSRSGYHHDFDEDLPLNEPSDSQFVRFRRYIADEFRLMLIYISLAFVFTWLMGNRPIDWITIFRWCIEASWTPHILLALIGTYSSLFDEYLFDFDIPLMRKMVYMIKGCLFVWMRYTEWYPSSTLNDYQTFFFYEFCNKFDLYRRPDDHRLRQWIDR